MIPHRMLVEKMTELARSEGGVFEVLDTKGYQSNVSAGPSEESRVSRKVSCKVIWETVSTITNASDA